MLNQEELINMQKGIADRLPHATPGEQAIITALTMIMNQLNVVQQATVDTAVYTAELAAQFDRVSAAGNSLLVEKS
jgi:hypothetical protein